jgi:hypothetical protein
VIRRSLVALVVLGMGTVVALQLDGPVMVAAWAVVTVVGVVSMTRRAWPDHPSPTAALRGGGTGPEARPLRLLASLELEVAAALDPRLSGDRPLRRRLIGLIRHRAGIRAATVPDAVGCRLVGETAWRSLVGRVGPLDLEQVEELVGRLEEI